MRGAPVTSSCCSALGAGDGLKKLDLLNCERRLLEPFVKLRTIHGPHNVRAVGVSESDLDFRIALALSEQLEGFAGGVEIGHDAPPSSAGAGS